MAAGVHETYALLHQGDMPGWGQDMTQWPAVTIFVSPAREQSGEWTCEVGVTDPALAKKWGDPLFVEEGFSTKSKALRAGKQFAKRGRHKITEVKTYTEATP